jgi:hypothetical protein
MEIDVSRMTETFVAYMEPDENNDNITTIFPVPE